MTLERPAEYLISLVRKLCGLNQETEWVEFKVNVRKPEEVGEYISAQANSAALVGKAFAYADVALYPAWIDRNECGLPTFMLASSMSTKST